MEELKKLRAKRKHQPSPSNSSVFPPIASTSPFTFPSAKKEDMMVDAEGPALSTEPLRPDEMSVSISVDSLLESGTTASTRNQSSSCPACGRRNEDSTFDKCAICGRRHERSNNTVQDNGATRRASSPTFTGTATSIPSVPEDHFNISTDLEADDTAAEPISRAMKHLDWKEESPSVVSAQMRNVKSYLSGDDGLFSNMSLSREMISTVQTTNTFSQSSVDGSDGDVLQHAFESPPNHVVVSGGSSSTERISSLSSSGGPRQNHVSGQRIRGAGLSLDTLPLILCTVPSQDEGDGQSISTAHPSGITSLLRLMDDKPENVHTQVRCSGDVCYFLWENEKFNVQERVPVLTKTVASKVLEAMLRAMRIHNENSSVQRNALSAIEYLCSKDDDIAYNMIELGGVEQVLLSMTLFENDTFVQRQSLSILRTISVSSLAQHEIHQQGGSAAITNTLTRHGSSLEIAHACEDLLGIVRKHQEAPFPVLVPSVLPHTIRGTVHRYNRNVPISTLRVDCEDIERMYKRLKRICPRGLEDSFVYDPQDLSVFVRKEYSLGYIVDVALCTQDQTHRSNASLDCDIVNLCDHRVGVVQARMRVPNLNKMHPIVQEFARDRLVDTIACPTSNLCSIQLAASYSQNRTSIPRNAIANDVWGYEGDDPTKCADFDGVSGDVRESRRKLDFDGSSDDRDLFSAWLICMTLFQRGTTEAEQQAIRRFVADCNEDFWRRKMTKNVNYESMFRSTGPAYTTGRLRWPWVLGLCLAKSIKEEFKQSERNNFVLRQELGTYEGKIQRKNLRFVVSIIATIITTNLLSLLIVVGLRQTKPRTFMVVAAVVAIWVIVVVAGIGVCCYFPQRWCCFPLGVAHERASIDRNLAVQLLLSPYCLRNFDGTNLSFTGATYRGTSTFQYRFTYKDLQELGFDFYCDSWGREHLRVPKTEVLVRMERTEGNVDYFVCVKDEPKLLLEKAWYSTTTYPG